MFLKGTRKKWSPGNNPQIKHSQEKSPPIKNSHEKRSPGEKILTKNGPGRKRSLKIVLRQRNARKFERMFGEITIYSAPSFDREFIICRRKEIEIQVVKIKFAVFHCFFSQFSTLFRRFV